MWFDKIGEDRAQALPVRTVLPAEHFPEGMFLKKCGVVEVPLVHKKDVDRVV